MTAILQSNRDVWLRARCGYLTASRMKDAIKFLKNGDESADRAKLKMEIIAERLADCAVDHYVTPEMRHGLESEPWAIMEFEMRTGMKVIPGAFIEHPKILFFGATPDGFIESSDPSPGHDLAWAGAGDELLEVKCPSTAKHLAWLMGREVPDEHKPQMLAQLACTGKKRVNFVSYDPRLKPAQQLFYAVYEPSRSEIDAIEQAAVQFLSEVDAMFTKITEAGI